MKDPNSPAAVLESLRAWKARNNWSAQNIGLAIQIHCGGDARVSATAINDWLLGKRVNIDPTKAGYVREFMNAHFEAPSFNEWRMLHDKGELSASVRVEDIQRRREERERERSEYQARCLAAERKPQRSSTPAGIIPPEYAMRRRETQGGQHAG